MLRGLVGRGYQHRITADVAGLSDLSGAIEKAAQILAEVKLEASPGAEVPAPFRCWMTGIRVAPCEGLVTFKMRGATLNIQGSAPALRTVAGDLAFLARQSRKPGTSSPRLSILWHEDHPYLAKDSDEISILREPIDPAPRFGA